MNKIMKVMIALIAAASVAGGSALLVTADSASAREKCESYDVQTVAIADTVCIESEEARAEDANECEEPAAAPAEEADCDAVESDGPAAGQQTAAGECGAENDGNADVCDANGDVEEAIVQEIEEVIEQSGGPECDREILRDRICELITGADVWTVRENLLDILKNCGAGDTYDLEKIAELITDRFSGNENDVENAGGEPEAPDQEIAQGDEDAAQPPVDPEQNLPGNGQADQNDISWQENAPQNGAYSEAYANEVIRLVNAERAKYGLAALTRNENATYAANIRAKEITSLFSHTRPDGRSCFTVADDLGFNYRSAGENIAYGQRSPEEVVEAWMNSEGHRANILSSSFREIGVSCFSQGGVLYWAQFFMG